MSEQAIDSVDFGADERRTWNWKALLRRAAEGVLLFAAAVAVDQVINYGDVGPHVSPLWVPVLILSLQHGSAAGLTAAAVACLLYFWDGWPAAAMAEDMYAYVARIAAEPVGWTCVAMLIGHVRSRQIEQTAALKAELAEQSQRNAAIAGLCTDLRRRAEILERHIAANTASSAIDVAEAVAGLNEATWDNFLDCLTRFIALVTGSADFSIYLLRGDTLNLVYRSYDPARPSEQGVELDDTLFASVIRQRRTLSAARPDDRALLAGRGVLFGPLIEPSAAHRVIGMLGIGGPDIVDFPSDVERRFQLTCAQISKLLARVILIDGWGAIAPPERPLQSLAARSQPGGEIGSA